MLPFALLLLQAATPAPEPETQEVVVTARKRGCEVAVADRIINDREFRARAKEWAKGTPVHVTVGSGASYRCLAKIAFRLADYGVTRIVFDTPGTTKD